MQMRLIITILLSSIFFISCNIEKKIAEEYLEKFDSVPLLILEPEYCYMINSNLNDIEDIEKHTQEVKDSLLYANSNYVRFLEESIIRYVYLDSLFIELQNLGFVVYNSDSLTTFLTKGEHGYVINIAQMQLLESLEQKVFSEVFDSLEHFVETSINRIDFDVWIELSELNAAENDMPMQLFYTSSSLYDEVSLKFHKKFLTQEVNYEKEYKPIEFTQIISLTKQSGVSHAQAIFDFFLNQYIDNNLPDNRKRKYNYSYNRKDKVIVKTSKRTFRNISYQ
jgi:hypothetical protein